MKILYTVQVVLLSIIFMEYARYAIQSEYAAMVNTGNLRHKESMNNRFIARIPF